MITGVFAGPSTSVQAAGVVFQTQHIFNKHGGNATFCTPSCKAPSVDIEHMIGYSCYRAVSAMLKLRA